ncbi:MAG: hypothetical protein V4498_09405 [candidate division FCPU426 bacterium]
MDNNDPAEPVFLPLVMEERDELKRIFKNPAFVKAWNNLRCVKPGVFIGTPAILAGKKGARMATNRFHEIRGWEMFSAGLLNQAKEPVVKKKPITEDYPDEGTLEADVRRQGPSVPGRLVPGQPQQTSGAPPAGLPKPPPSKPSRNRKP